jgi:hypothetical protein
VQKIPVNQQLSGAPRAGFEPAAYSLGGSRSIRLSYRGSPGEDSPDDHLPGGGCGQKRSSRISSSVSSIVTGAGALVPFLVLATTAELRTRSASVSTMACPPTVKAEFDSRPTGAVRQVVIDDAREFLAFLTRELRNAQEAGDLDPSVEPEQIAFELDALGAAAHQQFQLMHDPAVCDRAERAISARLDALTTKA